jgi:hypothetical protein
MVGKVINPLAVRRPLQIVRVGLTAGYQVPEFADRFVSSAPVGASESHLNPRLRSATHGQLTLKFNPDHSDLTTSVDSLCCQAGTAPQPTCTNRSHNHVWLCVFVILGIGALFLYLQHYSTVSLDDIDVIVRWKVDYLFTSFSRLFKAHIFWSASIQPFASLLRKLPLAEHSHNSLR